MSAGERAEQPRCFHRTRHWLGKTPLRPRRQNRDSCACLMPCCPGPSEGAPPPGSPKQGSCAPTPPPLYLSGSPPASESGLSSVTDRAWLGRFVGQLLPRGSVGAPGRAPAPGSLRRRGRCKAKTCAFTQKKAPQRSMEVKPKEARLGSGFLCALLCFVSPLLPSSALPASPLAQESDGLA